MIQNFLAIFIKYGSTFLFVFLQLICFYFIVNHNKEQSEIWVNSSNLFTGSLYERYDNFTEYLNLKEENLRLAAENAELRERLLERNFKTLGIDSLLASNYEMIPAVVVNNSINKVNNTLTLNQGSEAGIARGMGVVSNDGVVGVVSHVSKHYARVNSLLSVSTNVSAIEKRTRSLGVINWDGRNSSTINMNSVPQYVPINVGDTILTSGYSTVFPKSHMIGTISQLEKNVRTGYYDIKIKLNNDLSKTEYVYIVKNRIHTEIEELEEVAENE